MWNGNETYKYFEFVGILNTVRLRERLSVALCKLVES